jgi:curved DNA-binding protein CbpA
MDPYKVLQVDPEAEDEVIQAAYRRLAQKYHPDVAGPEGVARMTAINVAWELLRDPARRAAHDQSRSRTPASEPAVDRGQRAAAGSPTSADRTPPPTASGHRASRGSADTVSSDWTSGRSSSGSGYDPERMREAEGLGAAGPPPGNATGTVLHFGRYNGWSLGEIGRRDVDYLEWLDRMPIGRPYRDEIDALLRAAGRRRSVAPENDDRRGLFRRR